MKKLLQIFVGLSLLNGCGQASHQEASPAPAAEMQDMAGEAAPVANGPAQPGRVVPAAATRLLVYHADLRLKVASIPVISARLDSLVRRSGGYLSAATETRENGEWRQEMTIRVPPGRFAGLLATVAGLGTVEEKKLSTDDVTAEYADVAARLRTKRAVEQRYVALLGQARKISEILEIEEKIGAVREEIESTESRLKTLNDQVAYSTIALACYQPLPQTLPDAPVVSLGSRVVEAFYDGWRLLVGLAIGTITIWPLLLGGAGAWWAVRRWRQRRASASVK